MTQREILKYALKGATEEWEETYKALAESQDSSWLIKKERKLYKDVEELANMIARL